ncbi:MAG: hypothetical protein V1668_04070 [Patescibacteria group bacterium]
MSIEQLFCDKYSITQQLIERGGSHESLRDEYLIGHDDKRHDPFAHNFFVCCSDDSGTPCLTLEEYHAVIHQIELGVAELPDRQFLNTYLQNRIREYWSNRRGACVALRGRSYYRMIETRDAEVVYRSLIGDFDEDVKVLNFMARSKDDFPKELSSLVVEHVKNAVFRIMYAYASRSVTEPSFFRVAEWYLLDNTARTLWEMLVRILLQTGYQIESPIAVHEVIEIAERLGMSDDLLRIKELDSAKTLLRMADVVLEHEDDIYDVCMHILFGGIEIPYALYAYGIYRGYRHKFGYFIPAIFSLNRVKKSHIKPELLGDDGHITRESMSALTPKHFMDQLSLKPGANILLVDNNITTGYSIRMMAESLKRHGYRVHMAVAEVNIQEIKGICDGLANVRNKAVVLSGNDLHYRPVGEYVTCFGINDSSRVLNRIHVLLGRSGNQPLDGYDFDGTIFKTGQLHRMSWNVALDKLGIEFDVVNLPDNSGLTYKQAALNTYKYLISQGVEIMIPEDAFVKKLCSSKLEQMLTFTANDIIAIAKTVNRIREDRHTTKVIVTNNRLDFVLHCLQQKKLLEHFSYLFCEDYAYCVQTGERVVVVGKVKPWTDAYLEASTYYQLPSMQVYFGDDKKIDQEFSSKLRCKFELIVT